MPPKKARATPPKARGKKALVSPVLPLPSPPPSSRSPSPRSPTTLSHTLAPPTPSPPPDAHKKRTKDDAPAAVSAAPRTPSLGYAIGGVVLLLVAVAAVALLSLAGSADTAPRHHPCACAAASAASNPLAKAALSRRSGVSGVHWQRAAGDADRLDASMGCADTVVAPLRGPFATVAELRAAMQAAFQTRRAQCVVWVTKPEAVHGVANALKELLENNALAGATVVPPHARGTLVMESPLSREELKHKLPHRVVHMFTTISQ